MKYLTLFEKHSDYVDYTQGEYPLPNVSYCIREVEAHFHKAERDYSKEYLTFEAVEDTTFKFTKAGLSYSLDNGDTWAELAAETATPTVNTGNKILFKGTMTPSQVNIGIGQFSGTGKFNASGNVMSLLFGDNFIGQTDLTGKDLAFGRLFYHNTNLVDAANLTLPATTLAENCYSEMFDGCTSLVTTPTLPANTLAVFCYSYMFQGCTSLTTAPKLPAPTLAVYCYGSMFNGCTSLTTAPELPATTLVDNCYTEMFRGCSNLNYIKAMFTTIPPGSYTANWVSGVAATGTFVKNSAATWDVTGNDGVPSGWTIETASE
jgi:hypothetical protein